MHEAAAVVQPAAAADEVDEDMSHLTPEEFRKLQMEVEQLGECVHVGRGRKRVHLLLGAGPMVCI